MTLEFSAPRELGSRRSGSASGPLRALLTAGQGPDFIRGVRAGAGPAEWRRRGHMMAARDALSDAYADYRRALALDPHDREALDGLVRMAILTRRQADAVSELQALQRNAPANAPVLVGLSKLHASQGQTDEAIRAARLAAAEGRADQGALEQMASIHADASDAAQLALVVQQMRQQMAPQAATSYYAAVLALLNGDAAAALQFAEAAVAVDAGYAAAYDLIGAAHARLGQRDRARQAFLQSLEFDAHDSTAYANLGILALEERKVSRATDFFAEALWLDPESPLAREGLRRALRAAY
jgi:tetratricopeptide (TPR) repeat protein